MLNVESVKTSDTIAPAIPDELLEDDRKETEKKAAAARLKAKAAEAVKAKQYAAYDKAYSQLTQRISNTRILTKLLCGSGRGSLSEADLCDLDAMLLDGLEAIEEAALAVGDVLHREGVWA